MDIGAESQRCDTEFAKTEGCLWARRGRSEEDRAAARVPKSLADRAAAVEIPIDIDPAPTARGDERIAHLGAVDDDHRYVDLHRVAQLVAHSRAGRLERLGKAELQGN